MDVVKIKKAPTVSFTGGASSAKAEYIHGK